MSAELFAIYKAVWPAIMDMSLQNKPVLILGDSQAALQLISSTYSGSYRWIVIKIEKLMQIKGLDRVVMCWICGHSQILGNEITDRIANLLHSNDRSARSTVRFEEWLQVPKSKFLEHWAPWILVVT
jgi:ribonuclease HI